jgi:hypothetical protein
MTVIAACYMKSLRSVSSPLSSDSELDDELWVGFLEGVDRLLISVALLEPTAAVVLRGLEGEEWPGTVALADFLAGVETTCRECSIITASY